MQTGWTIVALVVTASAPAYARPTVVASIDEQPATVDIDADRSVAADPPPPPVSHAFAAIHVNPPEDPRIRIDHTATTVREVRGFDIVTLSVTASSTEDFWHDTDLIVSVPRAARVVGLALEQGGHVQAAALVDANTARERFDESTRLTIDPAMVELVGRGRDYDRLRLSMYPISNEQTATTKLTIVVPRVERLVVDLVGQRQEYRAGTPDLPTVSDRALLAAAAVTRNRSLYVAPANDPRTDVQALIRASRAALRQCNLDDGSVAHFTIAMDGTVRVREIQHASTEAAGCASRTIEKWQFARRPAQVGISYSFARR